MKAFVLALLALALLGAPANADLIENDSLTLPSFTVAEASSRGWNAADTALLVLRLIDWGQTRDIATRQKTYPGSNTPVFNPDGTPVMQFIEYNPILGPHPSIAEVNTYFTICLLVDWLIFKYANNKIKTCWLQIGIPIELYCTLNNYAAGIKFRF